MMKLTTKAIALMGFAYFACTSYASSRALEGSNLTTKYDFTKIMRNDIIIEHSFYQDGIYAGIPRSILDKISNIYPYGLKKGEKISILYTCDFDMLADNKTSCDDILYAKLELSNATKEIFLFEYKHGQKDYYLHDKLYAEERFLKAPIDMSKTRVSSNFGVRTHPISKRRKAHNGVDFAAPTGTKIYAAADGVITKRYRSRSGGNLIEINHGDYITVYMHQSRFARGLEVGSYVQRGQLIGYVGSTGFSTGPHLHYELREAKTRKAVNPFKMTPTAQSNKLIEVSYEEFDARQRHLRFIHGLTETMLNGQNRQASTTFYTNNTISEKMIHTSNQFLFSQNMTIFDIVVKERPITLERG